MHKLKFISLFFFLSIILDNCAEYTINKSDTASEYKSFLEKNKSKLEIIMRICYNRGITYITTDSLKNIIKEESLNKVIDNIKYINYQDLPDYKAYDFKLIIRENKCTDFFLTRPLISIKNDTSWDVKVVDKSPCF